MKKITFYKETQMKQLAQFLSELYKHDVKFRIEDRNFDVVVEIVGKYVIL